MWDHPRPWPITWVLEVSNCKGQSHRDLSSYQPTMLWFCWRIQWALRRCFTHSAPHAVLTTTSWENLMINWGQQYALSVTCPWSRRRGSDVVLDDIDFPMAILAYFFLITVQHYCHIRQTICSTKFGVRVCLLVVWWKKIQPPLYSPPKFKIFHCKMRFFVKIAHLL